MDSVTKMKHFGNSELQDSGFLSGVCTTESDLSAFPSEYQILDSGVDVSENLSKLEIQDIDKDEYPMWEYFFVPDHDGDNQLHIAVLQGYLRAVSTLITLIPHSSVLDFQNNLDQTALHISVLSRQIGMTHLLVRSGAKIDVQDSNGNTPLHLAAATGDVDCLQALTMGISAGSLGKNMPNIDLTNFDGLSAIHLAAKNGHCDVIRALHWIGADLNIGDGKGGRTPLHYAIAHNQVLAAHCLINECGSGLEVETYGGYTPFELAKENNSGLAQELVLLGAIPYESMDESSDSDSESEIS